MPRSSLFAFLLVLLVGCGRSERPVVTAPQPAADIAVAPKEKPVVPKGRNPKQKWAKELTDLDAKVAALKGDYEAKTQELLKWLKARPEYEDSGISRIGNVWARFTDGRLVMVPFPAPGTRGSEQAPAAPPPAAAPPGAAPPGAAPTPRFVIPKSKKAYMFEPCSISVGGMPSLNSPIKDHLTPWLTAAGYEPTLKDGTLSELRALGDVGIFYIDTHGLEAPARGGVMVYGILIRPSDEADPAWEEDADQGRVTYVARGPTCITHKFVRHYMSFSDDAFVFINACSSDVDATFRQAFLDKGAAVYAGWTDRVDDRTANIVAKFYFDRLLGRNQFRWDRVSREPQIELENPKQRPFEFVLVFRDMQERSFDVDHFDRSFYDPRGAKALISRGPRRLPCRFRLHYSDKVVAPLTGLCPSLLGVYLMPSEKEEELSLIGQFGPGTPRVTVAGVPVEVKRWEGKSKELCMGMVVCSLPPQGPGSAGDVVMSVDGRLSNPVPLTEWWVRMRFTQERTGVEPPLKVTGTIDLHFRADIHSRRLIPHEAPRDTVAGPDAQILAALDSQVQWELSGKGRFRNSVTGAVEWAGSGKMVRKQTRVPDPPGGFDLTGQLDPQKKSISVSTFEISVDKGGTETDTDVDGKTRTTNAGFGIHAMDWKMALDDKFGIVKGEHVFSDDFRKTKLEWDAAPAKHPPTPETLSSLPLPKTAQALACLTQGAP